MKKFYITTPIYYVNSSPHLGHAYTSILCDMFTRFHAMNGTKTYFLTGTDEHGDKIFKSAAKNNITPQEFVDINAKKFLDLLPILHVKNSDFIRTTDQRHKTIVQNLLQKVYDKQDIYFAEYSGKYCLGCERYYGDDELVDNMCPDHKTVPELIHEKNYFFKMSKYWEPLKKYINEHPDFIQPARYKNEVLGLLNMEPQDLCISRPKSRLSWGIELPFDKEYVTYVWFDALINYISALDYPNGKLFQEFWSESHHVIAKDILKPHCIYWPLMLMSLNIPLPKKVVIHGYWLIDDAKMSKSVGRVVDPILYCNTYGADPFRYFLIRAMSFGKDASFSDVDFIKTCNADLSNNFGNLYARIVGLMKKNCDGKIPNLSMDLDEQEKNIANSAANLFSELNKAMEDFEPQVYCEHLISFANSINKYIDENKPWAMAKDPTQKERLTNLLRFSLECTVVLFIGLYPITPQTSAQFLSELGISIDLNSIFTSTPNLNLLKTDFTLPEKVTGFPRFEAIKNG
ncbi:MAG: methionine--tRNA ligase [Bacteriovoracaceae bacterium]